MYLDKFNAGALPHKRILSHSQTGIYSIIHFGLNTYTGREWGYGNEDPALFDPGNFNAEEIASLCKETGMDGLILVCKHHDGFCLWPTKTTDHNISKSPFRGGKGDLVREFADACKKVDIRMGFYVSPWDRNSPYYGTEKYLSLYREQLREIYSSYGPAFEAWFDGANGGDGYYGGACETRKIDHETYYDWENTWKIVRELQKDAAIFSDAGPDLRWAGNEKGLAHADAFSCYTPHSPLGEDHAPVPGGTIGKEGEKGNGNGAYFMPVECDVPLRLGWFHHESHKGTRKSLRKLVEMYFHSVGVGGFLNLGLAPSGEGIMDEEDAAMLREFKKFRDSLFASPRGSFSFDPAGEKSKVINLGKETSFNFFEMAEGPAEEGEKILSYTLSGRKKGGEWETIVEGEAIGRRRMKYLEKMVEAEELLLTIHDYREELPKNFSIALYKAPPLPEEEPPSENEPQYFPTEVKGKVATVDLGGEKRVRTILFIPHASICPGVPDLYKLEVSSDGINYTTLVEQGEFSNLRANPVPQAIPMPGGERKIAFCRFTALRYLMEGEEIAFWKIGFLIKR